MINDHITDAMIKSAQSIQIVSGEGEEGSITEYRGKRTSRAIKSRLTKERCQGDRWAYLIIDGMRV